MRVVTAPAPSVLFKTHTHTTSDPRQLQYSITKEHSLFHRRNPINYMSEEYSLI